MPLSREGSPESSSSPEHLPSSEGVFHFEPDTPGSSRETVLLRPNPRGQLLRSTPTLLGGDGNEGIDSGLSNRPLRGYEYPPNVATDGAHSSGQISITSSEPTNFLARIWKILLLWVNAVLAGIFGIRDGWLTRVDGPYKSELTLNRCNRGGFDWSIAWRLIR